MFRLVNISLQSVRESCFMFTLMGKFQPHIFNCCSYFCFFLLCKRFFFFFNALPFQVIQRAQPAFTQTHTFTCTHVGIPTSTHARYWELQGCKCQSSLCLFVDGFDWLSALCVWVCVRVLGLWLPKKRGGDIQGHNDPFEMLPFVLTHTSQKMNT